MKDKHFVVTIGREFGSGGKEVGEKLAAKLGVKCYDKELLAIAAKDSGLCHEIFEMHDEKPTNSFLYSIVMDTYAGVYNPQTMLDMPINQKVFLAQFETIKKIAENESCVIVGRCADYALENMDNLVSVFIHADIDKRIERIMKTCDTTERKKAKDMITKTDKKRASYYNYYTGKTWGAGESYDLIVNTSTKPLEKIADAIIDYLKKFNS